MDGSYIANCTEYDFDIIETLKERESLRKKVTIRSSEVKRRMSVVELIRNIAEQHSYQRSSVHLAIYMLDLFMTEHHTQEDRLNLVALTCFYVASKIEENDPKIPSLNRLCSFLGDSYTPGDFRALEVHILNFFDWHVTIPTAATFLDFFTLHCLQMDDFMIPADIDFTEARFAEFKNEIIRSSLRYLDVSLLCHKMGNVKPSLLAAACVAAARCITASVRAWSDHMTSVTGYSFQQIHGLCCIMAFELSPLVAAPSSIASSRKPSISDSAYLSEPEDSDESDESENVYSRASSDDSNSNETVCCEGLTQQQHSEDSESRQDVPSSSDDGYMPSNFCSSVKRKRNQYTSSSSSSSDSEDTCAKRQRVSYDLM